MLSEGLLATIITGCVGISGVIVSRFKCIVQMDGCCTCRSCKFGLLDNSIVDDHEVIMKTISLNGSEMACKSKNLIHVDSDDESATKEEHL